MDATSPATEGEPAALIDTLPRPKVFRSRLRFAHVFMTLLLAASWVGSPAVAGAQSAEEKGRALVLEAITKDDGFGDASVDMEMVLTNSLGKTSSRKMRTKTKEVSDDGDKLLVVFDEPLDVKGTAFLTVTHRSQADDQWIYLPALKRVKRISSSNKSGPFMGSEFAYEDLVSEEIEKNRDYKWLRQEACGELACEVVERRPVDKNSGYTRQLVWIDTTHKRFMKIEYYDRKDSLLKTQEFQNYAIYLDKFWRASNMSMVNHQSSKSTTLAFREYKFQSGLTERDFDQSSLERAR